MAQTRPLGPPMNIPCTGQLSDLQCPVEGGRDGRTRETQEVGGLKRIMTGVQPARALY